MQIDSHRQIPDLEPRFLAPDGWREDMFTAPGTGHALRYGWVLPPESTVLRGAVVILQGRSEFVEKHFETARDMLARGFAVWMMDWYGQGRSGRMLDNPHKDHSEGFQTHLDDLHAFIATRILPGMPDGTKLILLGHSMGGNLGLRYIAQNPGIFSAAAFSAPMLGIRDLRCWPQSFLDILLTLLRPAHTRYVPGGRDWAEDIRKSPGQDIFSGDPVRDAVHMAWCRVDPALRLGHVTFGWVYNALKSCEILRRLGALEDIGIPCLFAAAGREALVDNRAIVKAAKRIPGAVFLELSDARHEILMETDDIRNRFLAAFDKMLEGIV